MSEEIPGGTGGEFEREPVPEKARKGSSAFWGMYAGEHTAGTEFMIGPLFVAWGASAFDMIFGLLLGNLLAVLTWRYLTAEIATARRLTLYYQLEKICGRNLVVLYNLFNGILFCFLAGAMVTVSATAVGVPFGESVKMPTFDQTWPTGIVWCLLCVAIGAAMTFVAVRGYGFVARVGHLAAPWMFLVFVACGVVMLAKLDSTNLFELIDPPEGAPRRIGFWGIVFFAWFCNAAVHLGMSDLSILRFARKPSYGWASAAGMFLGHYVAWICAALLLVYWVRQFGVDPQKGAMPGPMVFDAVGVAGLLCIAVAGWTTANPTIYRAGLAFQGMFPSEARPRPIQSSESRTSPAVFPPSSPAPRSGESLTPSTQPRELPCLQQVSPVKDSGMTRTTATIIAGAVCTVAGVFPAVAMKLLDFVGLYGTILAPVGAVIVVDHFLAKRLGLATDYAEREGIRFNVAVLLAWAIPVAIGLAIYRTQDINSFMLPLPCWLACGALYILFSKLMNRRAGSSLSSGPARP